MKPFLAKSTALGTNTEGQNWINTAVRGTAGVHVFASGACWNKREISKRRGLQQKMINFLINLYYLHCILYIIYFLTGR